MEQFIKKNKIVINATEGGAKIKGCVQMSLKDAIDKYCTKTIKKEKIKDLLSYADNGDELIEKVIPLLKNDIETLDEIIIQSRRGLAANRGLKVLMKRKNHKKLLPRKKEKKFDEILIWANRKKKSERNFIKTNILFYEKVIKGLRKSKLKNIMILSYKNFMASEAAHIASKMNPLVNVAIYGASRQIQGRDLKVNETINNFLKNSHDALIRIKRNTLILNVAKNAAKSLKMSYKKTYKLLKEYNETKDDNLLINTEIEEINLDDAEEYFAAGNWAHPLLDSLKITKNLYIGSNDLLYIKAKKIYKRAIKMKNNAIEKAQNDEKENADYERKLLEYNELLEESKRIGREENKFKEALEMIQKAIELMPDETEARWGLATVLHHSGNIDESLKEYKNLIKDFPDNYMFQFEYGQVLLTNGSIKDGLIEINEAMIKTKETGEYDNFFSKLGDIYEYIGMQEEALSSYNSYLKRFPFDYDVQFKKGDLLSSLGRKKLAEKAWKKALEIKPDYKKG